VTRILWSPQALLDVESIRDYIARDSRRYAELVIRRPIVGVEGRRPFLNPVGSCRSGTPRTLARSSSIRIASCAGCAPSLSSRRAAAFLSDARASRAHLN
jgi:hypothetical protein